MEDGELSFKLCRYFLSLIVKEDGKLSSKWSGHNHSQSTRLGHRSDDPQRNNPLV